jgi:regulator of nucleoside diphosphate kinase
MKNRIIIISDADHQRLEALIESVRYDASLRDDYLDALEGELKRARVVPQSDMPPEVITMNSVVRLRDLDSEETEEYELAYPADADMAHNRIPLSLYVILLTMLRTAWFSRSSSMIKCNPLGVRDVL